MKLFLILVFLTLKAYSETQVFEAVAKVEGQLAYVERHTVVYEDQTIIKSLTEYLDAHGKYIGTLKSDFTHNLAAPDFILRDQRHHSLQGLRWMKGVPEAFNQEGPRTPVASRSMASTSKEIQISGPGLVYFVAANLEQIISKNILDFKYIIPGRLEAFDFYIKTLSHNQEVAEFEVRMKSWFMQLFGPRLKLIFNVPNKRLLFYEGISNLRDSEGKMMSVDIQYKYQD